MTGAGVSKFPTRKTKLMGCANAEIGDNTKPSLTFI